jgi:hypothetical protein
MRFPIRILRPFFAVLLLAGICVAQQATAPVAAPTTEPLDTFNYIAGTQVFGSDYHFTNQSLLIEGARELLAMKSNMIKFPLGPNHLKNGFVNNLEPDIHSLTQLAQQAEYKQVFNMPFSRYFLWTDAYSTNHKVFPLHGPIPPEVLANEYKEIYELTHYLLTAYNGTGKIFYLGNWEGDWLLIQGVPGRDDPALKHKINPLPDSPAAMASWLIARQRAVDNAKRDTPHKDVQVWFYVETNLVQKSVQENRASVARDVLPLVNPDYVSYSSYESTNPQHDMDHDLPVALNYMQSMLKPKPGLPAKRVFIGEYGSHAEDFDPKGQDARMRQVIAASIKWGTPFVLYWQLYGNTNKGSAPAGNWLINDKGVKLPVYYTYPHYYTDAKSYVLEFVKKNKRQPSDEEFQAFAYKWFTSKGAR